MSEFDKEVREEMSKEITKTKDRGLFILPEDPGKDKKFGCNGGLLPTCKCGGHTTGKCGGAGAGAFGSGKYGGREEGVCGNC